MMRWWPWRRREDEPQFETEEQTLHEVIVACRAWRIADGYLQSCTQNCIWQPRQRMDAHCNQMGAFHATIVPVWKCTCGFYAYKTDAALRASEFLIPRGGLGVAGRVALWGRVIDHEIGYRAQHSYPQVLYLSGDRRIDELIRRVADRYAVECVPEEFLVNS
jgi:hypothetical protein